MKFNEQEYNMLNKKQLNLEIKLKEKQFIPA